MDLKEFILETISAITDATSELQKKYSDDDVIINPPSALSGKDVFQTGSSNYTMRRVQNISFDVAVTASSEKAGGGEAGIKVLSIELGADGRKTVSDEQVSRVSFEVPMTLKPSGHEAKNMAKRVSEEQKPAEANDQ